MERLVSTPTTADRKLEPWQIAPPQLEDVYTFEDASLVGCMLITLLRHADRVKMACLAQLVNVIAPDHDENGGPAWAQTIYYPYHARLGLRPRRLAAARGQVARLRQQGLLRCPCDRVRGGRRSGKRSGLTLFLVNRDQEADVVLDGDLRQYRGLRVEEHIVLTHDDPKATNTMENPRRVFPATAAGRDGRPTGGSQPACPSCRGTSSGWARYHERRPMGRTFSYRVRGRSRCPGRGISRRWRSWSHAVAASVDSGAFVVLDRPSLCCARACRLRERRLTCRRRVCDQEISLEWVPAHFREKIRQARKHLAALLEHREEAALPRRLKRRSPCVSDRWARLRWEASLLDGIWSYYPISGGQLEPLLHETQRVPQEFDGPKTAWYAPPLPRPPEMEGKRLYLLFEGVDSLRRGLRQRRVCGAHGGPVYAF